MTIEVGARPARGNRERAVTVSLCAPPRGDMVYVLELSVDEARSLLSDLEKAIASAP